MVNCNDDGLNRVDVNEIHLAEATAFVDQINNFLRHDEHLKAKKMIPIDPPMKLFERTNDGVLLLKFINKIAPGTIKEKDIKLDVDVTRLKTPGAKDAWEIAENNNHVVAGAKSLGCKVVNIGSEDILSGSVDLTLGLVWQLIRAYLMKSVNLASHPELIRLLKPGENILKLMNLSSEEVILRWFNYHLGRSDTEKRIKNFGSDTKDCEAWVHLLKQVCGREAVDAGIDEVMSIADPEKRAAKLLECAGYLDCRDFTSPKDIVKGHGRLNLAFTATIFNEYIGIRLPTEDEIDAIYEELEEVKKKLGECREGCKHLCDHVLELERSKAALEELIKELEAKTENIDQQCIIKNQEYKNIKNTKNGEVERLTDILKEKTGKAQTAGEEIESSRFNFAKLEAEKASVIHEQIARIQVLEEELRLLAIESEDLTAQIEGKGSDISSMTEKLLRTQAASGDKSRLVQDHVDSCNAAIRQHASNLSDEFKAQVGTKPNNNATKSADSAEGDDVSSEVGADTTVTAKPTPEDGEDEEYRALKENHDMLGSLLKAYSAEIEAVAEGFDKLKAQEKDRLNQINKAVEEFLGEGQTAVGDGIANMKRLLELMMEKCKKQAIQIATLEKRIDQKNQMNDLMADKVRVIVEQKMFQNSKRPSKKKGLGVKTAGAQ
ncbi:hypothetical protein SARC_01020 [Sphaeroforma arctica JP610]|uniref:Calponin-homology (CH) domain-containing protein n=1 Tax=Sphaeroforma arctica JP610 TaxID=667725 RepID=A0A0L0GD60_9EUKA|nr:hypothetical protein SARC_01020 [Sphaeroforma arctica JP610]KNC86826.1 hypothetical protein SARC_01020 [Sphaeroforma arctica JP610]|eukprot:XP_014160728.1 hypothetical protein SARC_01020 [Sphaeroforma arctica JP610]